MTNEIETVGCAVHLGAGSFVVVRMQGGIAITKTHVDRSANDSDALRAALLSAANDLSACRSQCSRLRGCGLASDCDETMTNDQDKPASCRQENFDE